jgi:hypothetical protein
MQEFISNLFKSNSGVSSKRLISFVALVVLIVYIFVMRQPQEFVVYTIAGLVVSSQSLTVLAGRIGGRR